MITVDYPFATDMMELAVRPFLEHAHERCQGDELQQWAIRKNIEYFENCFREGGDCRDHLRAMLPFFLAEAHSMVQEAPMVTGDAPGILERLQSLRIFMHAGQAFPQPDPAALDGTSRCIRTGTGWMAVVK